MTIAERVHPSPSAQLDPDGTLDSRYYTKGEIDVILADYASANHAHFDIHAPLVHDHPGQFAAVDHDHDDAYAPMSHNHDGSYSAVGHTHAGVYAPVSHTHTSSQITDLAVARPPITTQATTTTGWYITTGTAYTEMVSANVTLLDGVTYKCDLEVKLVGEGKDGGPTNGNVTLKFNNAATTASSPSVRYEDGVDKDLTWRHVVEVVGTGAAKAFAGGWTRINGNGNWTVARMVLVCTPIP